MKDELFQYGGVAVGIASGIFSLYKAVRAVIGMLTGRSKASREDLKDSILHNDLFVFLQQSVKYDLAKVFNVSNPKDAQFYAIIRILFTVYNNNLKTLCRKVLRKEIKEITMQYITDLHFSAINEYSEKYESIGGSLVVMTKFNEWNDHKVRTAFALIKNFLTTSFKTTAPLQLVAVLAVYYMLFHTSLDDLRNMYKTLNGEVSKECEERNINIELLVSQASNIVDFDDSTLGEK